MLVVHIVSGSDNNDTRNVGAVAHDERLAAVSKTIQTPREALRAKTS
jgi:hypothetical protein